MTSRIIISFPLSGGARGASSRGGRSRESRNSPPAPTTIAEVMAAKEDGTEEEKQKLMDKEEIPEPKTLTKRDGTRYCTLARIRRLRLCR